MCVSQPNISSPPPPRTHTCTQTVTAVVVGGVIIWLVKKVGKPVAEYLDDRSQVRASYSYKVQVYVTCVWECKSLARYVVISMVTTLPQHTHQRILDGLNEGKNLNIRSLEEQIQAEKAVETYLEARHEAFEIIKVQQLKHVEKKQFEITSFPPFPPFLFFHPLLSLPFPLSPSSLT